MDLVWLDLNDDLDEDDVFLLLSTEDELSELIVVLGFFSMSIADQLSRIDWGGKEVTVVPVPRNVSKEKALDLVVRLLFLRGSDTIDGWYWECSVPSLKLCKKGKPTSAWLALEVDTFDCFIEFCDTARKSGWSDLIAPVSRWERRACRIDSEIVGFYSLELYSGLDGRAKRLLVDVMCGSYEKAIVEQVAALKKAITGNERSDQFIGAWEAVGFQLEDARIEWRSKHSERAIAKLCFIYCHILLVIESNVSPKANILRYLLLFRAFELGMTGLGILDKKLTVSRGRIVSSDTFAVMGLELLCKQVVSTVGVEESRSVLEIHARNKSIIGHGVAGIGGNDLVNLRELVFRFRDSLINKRKAISTIWDGGLKEFSVEKYEKVLVAIIAGEICHELGI